MYDGGNYLSTDLGSYLSYSGGEILSSPLLGQKPYFTAKYPGLFVVAADVSSIGSFNISGGLGADGGGKVDGAVISISKNGKDYLGFVKRVYHAGDPSVNHLFIVEDNGSATHSFSTNTNDDSHQVYGLDNIDQLYCLVYAGSQ